MAGPKERGGRGAGGSGEAQAQGQPRDSAMAPMQPSLGPPRDEPRVFGLEKFNGDNFAEWSFKMENIFDHYDLPEVMEGTEKRPENSVVLERQMAALRIEEDEAVEEGVQKLFDLLTRLEGADLNYSELQKKTKLLALLPESWSSLIINLNRDLPRLSLKDVKQAILQEDFRRRELASADGAGAASIGRGYGRGRGRGQEGSIFGSNNFSGGRGSGGYGSDNKNNGRGRGRFDGECHFCHKSGHMWRDCYKLPNGWTPAQGQEGRGAGGGRGRGRGGRGGRGGGAASMKSAGNESESRDDRFLGQFFFVSTQASAGLEKDEGFEEPAAVGKVTLHSLDYWVIDSGATYSMTPRADLLTELEPSPIPVVPMPKERQVAASISTKGEAVGSGDGANGRTKEIESKKCNLGGTSKLGEHEESGAAAKEQHKVEENPKVVAEEEYGENMWGTIASAAFSNLTSATGECDWLTLHRRMGHVALPILQQLVKNEMVAGIRVKGEPDEVLGCPTCMQAKFTRYPFSSSEATAKAPLDEVVMDVVAPLKLGAAGAEYFLTIVDVLSKKSDVAETVKTSWLPMVERQQDRLVKAIRTDQGGELLSKEFGLWLKKNGIRHSLTMPYSPAMNGIAERAKRTITVTARGLLVEAGLPDYFWPDAVRSACVAKNRALTHVGADKWVPHEEWIGRKPKVDILRVFGCMCMALVPKHLRHNKLGAKAIWAVHLGMAQNSKRWLLWDPFTKKFLVSRDCKFMENLMYKDWKAENEAKIGVRLGDVKSSGLEHVELPLELSSGSTTTRQSSLVNGGEEAKDAEEEEEEVQQVSERAPTLPSRTTSAPRIRVTPQQCQGLHVPLAEEERRGKRRIQASNRLTYDALGKPTKSALAGAALMVGEDEESDYEECAFKAMESELKSIEENGTWELVDLPKGRKAITSKWLFKIKFDANGKIERYKSRLVAKGCQQKEKVDYKELFAPVVKPTTLRTLLAGAAIKGWVVKQMDVTTAFLNGVLEEEIFMTQPEGFDDGSGRVLRLKNALYGLKQAPRQWYMKLRGVLEEIGFTPSTADHSLFMLGEGEQRSFMVVYVDEILIFSPSSDLVKEVMLKVQDKFKCKALGDVSFYLGLHIERDVEKRCMRVHQRKYLEALAANFGQSEGHVATPFPSGFKCVKGPEEESVGEEERRRFHSLVGSLIYAAVNTRPDVAFATGQLARVVQFHNEEQVTAGMRVAKYLGQTATVGLQYSAVAQMGQKGADGVEPRRLFLTAFSDAFYASEPKDMTSVGGFICCVGGGPTAWESNKDAVVNYKDLFATVVKQTTLRTLLAGAAIKGWVVKQMDVTTAFLNSVLEEEIFLAQPKGFDDGSGRVLRLKKALYGLKQAPRQWYLKLRGVLEEIGFIPSTTDHSLFMLGEGEQRSFMVVYVDDILIFSPSSDLVKEVMLKLQVQGPEEESVGEEERRRFHSLVDSLMYAAVNTRPDVAFATRQLASVVQCPNEEQVAAGMRVAKYLGQTPTVGLQYSAAEQRRQKGADGLEPGCLFLTAFSDASFASEPEDMTSVGGFICCFGGGPTAWESRKQVDQALSSVESEYMALFRAVREIVWQRRLLAELGEEQQGPTPLYSDSQGDIALAKNSVLYGLTKHMRVKWHWTRSMVAAGEVELHYVKTTRQPADMMTKRLVEQQHWKCCKVAGMALN
ncbi:unnamed protein product [Closterium sp. NIES-54]